MNSAQEIWQTALGEIQLQVSKPNYQTWFKDTEGLAFDGDLFLVGVPNAFVAEYLEKSQRSLIEKVLIGLVNRGVSARFRITWAEDNFHSASGEAQHLPALYGFNPRYTFGSFVVGSGNRMAHAAAQAATRPSAESRYNPLFIYAAPGLGKTHLLQAIGQQALQNNLKPVYVSGEQFTNDFIEALRERRTDEFRAKYRSADLLMVDDIHFIAGKEATEESFFHTFNDLHNAGRQIVITSDRHPKAMPQLHERLRSRFEWGLAVDIQPPDFETRHAILQTKAGEAGAQVSPDVLDLMARELKQNIRELEGSLNRIIAYARLLRAQITPELANKALKDVAGGPRELPAPQGWLDGVLGVVASSYTLTPDDLLGRGRSSEVAEARQVAMYLMRRHGGMSLSDIGRALGGRGASTVSHACEKISGDLQNSHLLRRRVEDIKKQLS